MTCPPCVICEVDGLPIDPVLFAERQAAEAEGRAMVERLLSAIPAYAPGRLVVPEPPERVTATQRGRTRRAAISAAIGAQAIGIGMPGGPGTGWSDRVSTKGGAGGMRRGTVHGRRKRQSDRVMDGSR